MDSRRGDAAAASQPHKLEDAGSNPAPAILCRKKTIGQSPSGKAQGFGPCIRWFDPSLPRQETCMKKNKWKLVKYKGDISIYAKCKCGFRYACSHSKKNEDGTWSFEQIVDNLYPYCPICGSRKTKTSKNVKPMDSFSWE